MVAGGCLLSLGKNGNKEVHGAATKTTSQFIGSLWSPAAWKIPTWLQTHNYLLVGTDTMKCATQSGNGDCLPLCQS